MTLSAINMVKRLPVVIAIFSVFAVCIPLLFIACVKEPTLSVTSIDPEELLEDRGKFYKLKGTGFSHSTRIYLNIRAFCGSNPETLPDYSPKEVAEDGTWLDVYIRPYGKLSGEHVCLTVIDGERVGTPYEIPVRSHYKEIYDLVESLSLEELIGQTLMVGFDALENAIRISNDGLCEIIRDFKIGNAIIFKHNLPRETDPRGPLSIPDELSHLTNELQEAASKSQLKNKKIPLIIAVDQEGGSGNRLRGPKFTQVAEHTFIGITRDLRLAREAGFVVGAELRYLGVNANLAPIADIVTTTYDRIKELNHNPTIGVRAFGAHMSIVNEMSTQYMKGLQDGGVLAIAKHFPGHGSSLENPHEVLPNIGIETEPELMNTSMVPFKLLIDEGVNGLLTSHIKVPPWDDIYPVTFSNKIIEEKLRNELGFEGLVVTDDMSVMDGILKSEPSSARPTGIEIYTRLEAIKMAHKAGHDITIIGVIYPEEKVKERERAQKLKKNPITLNQLHEIVRELMSLYGDEEELERLRQRVRRILFQKALLFGFDNFKNPANWRVNFVPDEYEQMLTDHSRTADKIQNGSVVLLSEGGQVWGKKEKFRYFGDGWGPLSKNSFLVSEGDRIALASPVHSPPDELYEAIMGKVKWFNNDNEIKTVHMVYGYSEGEIYKARERWPGEHIEIIHLLNSHGNFIFREGDIKREHFPSDEDEPDVEEQIIRLKEKARAIDHFIDEKVEQIIAAAKGKKVLIFAIVTRPQIEILERLHAHLTEDLPSVHIIVLLFKEPFLVSRSIYENKMITVLNLSAFPELTKAAEVLVGQISPNPAQYSALNAPRTPISFTGGAGLNLDSMKEIHQLKERVVRNGFVFPELVWTLLAGILGGIFFCSILLVSSSIRLRIINFLVNGLISSVVALILHFLFPFIKQIVVLGVTIEAGSGFFRLVIVFLISFLFNAFWFKFIKVVSTQS